MGVSGGVGGVLRVSPGRSLPRFALVVGCFSFFREVCLCACVLVCLCVSVAVFVACQDVEVAVGCRVVCRPALQHHHPARQTHTHTGKNTTSGLVSREGNRRFISRHFAFPVPDERTAQSASVCC